MSLDIKPVNYELVFEPNLKTFKFSGKEKIKIKILKIQPGATSKHCAAFSKSTAKGSGLIFRLL